MNECDGIVLTAICRWGKNLPKTAKDKIISPGVICHGWRKKTPLGRTPATFFQRQFFQELLVLVAKSLADLVSLVLRNLLAALLFDGAHFEVLLVSVFVLWKERKFGNRVM